MASLALPADYFTLQDALEMGRISDGSAVCEVEVEWERLEGLVAVLPRIAGIYELNHLAERLAALDETESQCFQGLVKIEINDKGKQPVSLERLINMAYSLGDCQLLGGVHNDADLGKFYVENEFLPELETLTDEQFEGVYPLLDLAKIGAQMRQADRGVFVASGYLFSQAYPEVAEAYHSGENVRPEHPGYMLRLYTDGEEADALILDMPADESSLRAAFASLSAKGENEGFCFYVSGTLPSLQQFTGEFAQLEGINELAKALQSLEGNGQLAKFKAVTEAVDPADTGQFITLAARLDEYVFFPEMELPEDYAATCLNEAPSPPDTYLLLGYLDAESYGQAMMARHHVAATEYGYIGRHDRRPLHEVETVPEQGQSFTGR